MLCGPLQSDNSMHVAGMLHACSTKWGCACGIAPTSFSSILLTLC